MLRQPFTRLKAIDLGVWFLNSYVHLGVYRLKFHQVYY